MGKRDTSINDIPPRSKEFVYLLNESTSTLANENKQAGTLKVGNSHYVAEYNTACL
jgi:hypothetical protein